MEIVLVILAIVLVAVGLGAFLMLLNADIAGGILLKYTLEPFSRWCLRVFWGADKPVVGREALIGAKGIALSGFDPTEDPGSFSGRVEIRSESWTARSRTPIKEGTHVRVLSASGTTVDVDAVS